jgi:phosphoglycerate-specific signal transduction histidine kinase
MQTPSGAALVEVLPRDSLSVAADVAIVVVAVAVVILALVTAFLLLRIGRAVGEIRLGVRQNLGPVSDRARAISDNVEFITQALRTDVERLNASVKSLTERLQLASDRMEERIEEFNALMEVVQDEAEDIFIDTASTVRGVRAGARAMAVGRRTAEAHADVDESDADAEALAAEET